MESEKSIEEIVHWDDDDMIEFASWFRIWNGRGSVSSNVEEALVIFKKEFR